MAAVWGTADHTGRTEGSDPTPAMWRVGENPPTAATGRRCRGRLGWGRSAAVSGAGRPAVEAEVAEHLRLTFPENRVTQPVIYHLVKDYDVVPNIRRAAIENHFGWLVLELEGDPDRIQAAKLYLAEQGIEISSAEGDIVAG